MIIQAIQFPNFDPVAFAIGPIQIRWYGLAYVAGLVIGWLYIRQLLSQAQLWNSTKIPLLQQLADNMFVWVAAGIILGGRLGHALFYLTDYYLKDPLQILFIWKGGMSFHGGLLGAGLAIALFARRQKVNALVLMDLAAAAAPIGLFFGRIANFINGEVVGSPTSMPWGMVFPEWGAEPRHPAMLYEAILEGIVLFIILRHLTHSRMVLTKPGYLTGSFLIGYGFFRIFCELFKIVDYRLIVPSLPITKGMVLTLPMIVIGAVFLMRARLR